MAFFLQDMAKPETWLKIHLFRLRLFIDIDASSIFTAKIQRIFTHDLVLFLAVPGCCCCSEDSADRPTVAAAVRQKRSSQR
jgi:hypothetical protein